MSDLSILKKAKLEGVEISLNPDGTIRATGSADILLSIRDSLQRNKTAIVEHLKLRAALEQFQFDLVEAEIAAGAPAAEIYRTNNLAWRFMEQEGMPFGQAIAVAASIVVACEPAPGESEYTDVRSLWHELTGNQQTTSTNRRES